MRSELSKKQHHGKCFSLSFVTKNNKASLHILIAKKYTKNVVERNKIKRWARELWRRTGIANYSAIQTNVHLTTSYNNCTYNNMYNDFKNASELLEGMKMIQ